jgi:hypothetical protein
VYSVFGVRCDFSRWRPVLKVLSSYTYAPVGLPEHASLARRLGDRVGDDGARAAPRRLMLASVLGEPALLRVHASPKRKREETALRWP